MTVFCHPHPLLLRRGNEAGTYVRLLQPFDDLCVTPLCESSCIDLRRFERHLRLRFESLADDRHSPSFLLTTTVPFSRSFLHATFSPGTHGILIALVQPLSGIRRVDVDVGPVLGCCR